MTDIELRGELINNDDAKILRFYGFRDITCPEDIRRGLEEANGDEVTLLINSEGGSMVVGTEIASMLRRYSGKTTALYQGFGASAATIAASGCSRIEADPGALLCYHNPMGGAAGDYHAMSREAESLRAARDCIRATYQARGGTKSKEELEELMDRNVLITPVDALNYGLIDAVTSPMESGVDPRSLTASAGNHHQVTAKMREIYMTAQAGQQQEPAPLSSIELDRRMSYIRMLKEM